MRSILDYGAKAEADFDNARAIQAALDDAHAAGGGTVHVPAGRFLTTTVELRSHTTLHLHGGATLAAWPNVDDYPDDADCETIDRGAHDARYLIRARDAEHVTLSGTGVIDGQGPSFWEPIPGPRTWVKARKPRVSPMLDFRNVRDLRICDITLHDSPGWTLHAYCCDRVWIRGIRIDDYLFGPNTDGLDINGCRDVMVSDCHISCGDDAIVLKATRDARSCERVTVTNCVLRTNCVAMKCGTESWHDFRQITFSNCVAYECSRIFGLYAMDGGTMEQILVSNVTGDTECGFVLNRPIHIDIRKRSEDSLPSTVRDVQVRGFSAATDGRILMTCTDGCRVERLSLRDVTLRYDRIDDPDTEGSRNARSSQYSSHSPEARVARAAVVAEGLGDLLIDGLRIAWPDEPDVPMAAFWGKDLHGARVDLAGVSPSDARAAISTVDSSCRKCTIDEGES